MEYKIHIANREMITNYKKLNTNQESPSKCYPWKFSKEVKMRSKLKDQATMISKIEPKNVNYIR